MNWSECCSYQTGLDSTDEIVVGRSTEASGPYLDKSGKDMLEGGGSTVIQNKPSERIVGPCHAGIFKGGLYPYGGLSEETRIKDVPWTEVKNYAMNAGFFDSFIYVSAHTFFA